MLVNTPCKRHNFLTWKEYLWTVSCTLWEDSVPVITGTKPSVDMAVAEALPSLKWKAGLKYGRSYSLPVMGTMFILLEHYYRLCTVEENPVNSRVPYNSPGA